MTPGVGGILPREVLHGGITIDGTYFPPGVDVGVPIYALQHNSAYHPQPFDYIPERWLVDDNASPGDLSSAESVARTRSAFCPFSLGPRGCVGRGMAYKELMIVTARLLFMFDMRIAEGTTAGQGDPSLGEESLRHRIGEFQGLDKFVLQADGPMVEFKLRDGIEVREGEK
jgi:cytochrome P450